jgi:hypothetical protein
MRREIASLVLVIGVLFSILVYLNPLIVEAQVPPGPASDKITARSYSITASVDAITKTPPDIYLYMFALRPAQAEQLKGNPNVQVDICSCWINRVNIKPSTSICAQTIR